MKYNVYLFKDAENHGAEFEALEYLKRELDKAVDKQVAFSPDTVVCTGKSCGDPYFNVEVKIGKEDAYSVNSARLTFNDGLTTQEAALIITHGFGIGVWYSETRTVWTVLICSPDKE